ncbi:single-stranded DNA-binding protein [Trueperella sp. LYQ143]|uniref:single-stranded DNA-binding protein n=1 Tax=unclassified Trueperella TaxID=2630174 RepID=UPI00398380D7
MAGEPNITVVGNLTADPQLKYTQSGAPVANFSVACTPRFRSRNSNDWQAGETMFFNCAAWGAPLAENVADTLSKGMRVVISGQLRSVRAYERKDGTPGASAEITVDEVAPSLRYARAEVTKTSNGGMSEFGNAQYGQDNRSGGYGQSGHASYHAPQGGSMNDPWGGQPEGSAFDNPPGF